MAGLDHAAKLRRGIGKGNIVAAEELTTMLEPYDQDGDGSLTRDELKSFLVDHHCGGPWFCGTLANTIFAQGERLWATDVEVITTAILGRVINHAMNRPERPSKRYVLTPMAAMGLEPKVDLKGNPVEGEVKAPSEAAPRPRGAPRGRARSAPRGRARTAPRGRTPPRRSSGRSGRPSGRPSGRRAGPRGPRRK